MKKVGSEKPTNARVLAIWSKIEYGRVAAKMPTGSATAMASSCAAPITIKVVHTRWPIRVSTLMRLTNENPQSPCAIASSQRT